METSYVSWLRGKIGVQKVFLPFTSVVARDEDGRILLQRRTDFDFWGLPGGVLELDEDVETCARRELLEETGLRAGPLRLVGVYTDPRYDVIYPNGDQVQQCTICLEGTVIGGRMQPDGVEASDQRFTDPAQTDHYPLPLWYRDMIADALKGGPPVFRKPYTAKQTTDQIKSLRRSIGSALCSGIGASAIITNEEGQILMLQHAGETGWRHPAGFCDLGENVAQTAVREVWEETRLHIAIERILAVHATPKLNVTYANGDQIRNVGTVFKAHVVEGTIELDQQEVVAAAWMSPEEVLAHSSEHRRWFFQKLIEHLEDGYFVC